MTRVISVSDMAYNELMKLKEGLSFSEVIVMLTKMRKADIMDFAGTWNNKEALKIKKELMEERKIKFRRFK